MATIKDDRGYSQGFVLAKSTTVRMQRRTELILSGMTITPATRILEIGCGTGEVSYWMASRSSAQVLGTDLCVPFIEDAKKKYQLPNLEYAVVDFNTPDSFSGQTFDYIVGNGILHHLYHNLDEVSSSMLRLLKEKGEIIFLEPNLYNPYIYFIFSFPKLRALTHLEPDEMAFSKRHITNVLTRVGFESVRVTYKDFLLPGIPDFLITPSVVAGAVLEKIPLLNKVAQSIFIKARKPLSGTPTVQSTKMPLLNRSRFLFLARYGISGLTGGAIQVISLYIWITLLGFKSTYLLGLILGFVVALIVTFTLQKYWAFRDTVSSRAPHQLFSYSVVAVLGLVLNTVLLTGAKAMFEWFSLDFFHGWYLIAQTVIVCIVALFNFSMNFLFTFRHARKERSWNK